MPYVKNIEGFSTYSNSSLELYMPLVEEISLIDFKMIKGLDAPNLKTIGIDGKQNDFMNLAYINVPNSLICKAGSAAYSISDAMSSRSDCTDNGGYLSCGSCGDEFVKSGTGCVAECGNGFTANTETKQCVKNSAPEDSSTPSTNAHPTAASCAGDGKVLQGKSCVAECGSSFRLNDGECDRIRYTPAEAAQYLKDTDNTIIMTFKVNR